MADLLAELFSSKVRAAVLAHLLPRPHLGFSLTDLSRRLDLPISSLQHECYKLTRLGLLRDERAGAARLYRPDPASPLLPPLAALVVAAIGRTAALAAAAEAVAGLHLALLADRMPPPTLVVVGELPLEALDSLRDRVAAVLGPDTEPGRLELAYFRPSDWQARRAAGDGYLADLLSDSPPSFAGVLTD